MTEPPPAERDTLIECPTCGGDTRRECDLCQGVGAVSAAVAGGWLFEKARKRFTTQELHAAGFARPPKAGT